MSTRPRVAVVGTFDTKSLEFEFLRDCLVGAGVDVVLVDTGVMADPSVRPDIAATVVAARGGADLATLRGCGDRARAIGCMSRGAAVIVRELYDAGDIAGAMCLGGGQGSTIGAAALHTLPVGVPKLIVSTIAAVGGANSAVIGIRDTTLVNSVIDISGLNSVSRTIIANAAAAMAGMVTRTRGPLEARAGYRVALTMFGVTSRCADRVRRTLVDEGLEVLVFAATGSGDQSMEDLIGDGLIDGVVDLTTSQLGQGVVRGNTPGGPDRLRVAGAAGIPQVVSLGGLDIILCASDDDPLLIEARAGSRRHHQHSPVLTVVRPSVAESARIGAELGRRLSGARGPTTVLIPRRGLSEYSVAGGPLFDPAADEALISALSAALRPDIEVRALDTDINDPRFGDALVESFLAARADALVQGERVGGAA